MVSHPARSVHGLAAYHRTDRDRRRLDRPLVAPAGYRAVAHVSGRRSSIAPGATISRRVQLDAVCRRQAILVSWIVMALLLRVNLSQLNAILPRPGRRCGAPCLVGVFIFGLAYVFNFSGMAGSLAKAFSKLGPYFIVVAPILGFIGVALSGSNTSTNAMFGTFQALVGNCSGFPLMLLPTFNSVGAEIGKPIAPQTASVGVSTSEFVRNEGEVIRHNFGWTSCSWSISSSSG